MAESSAEDANKSNNPLTLAPAFNLHDYYTPVLSGSSKSINDLLLLLRGTWPLPPLGFVPVPSSYPSSSSLLAELMSTWNRPDAMAFPGIMVKHIVPPSRALVEGYDRALSLRQVGAGNPTGPPGRGPGKPVTIYIIRPHEQAEQRAYGQGYQQGRQWQAPAKP